MLYSFCAGRGFLEVPRDEDLISLKIHFFIYLAAPGLSRGTWDL